MNTPRKKLQLALSLISGRQCVTHLDSDDYDILGYDGYKFSYYGKPDREDILERAEQILLDILVPFQFEVEEKDEL